MVANAIPTEKTCPTDSEIARLVNNGFSKSAIAGSPSQPIPRAVIVMPSWQAERYSSRLEMTFFASTAFLLPSSISWSILELLTLTIANSDTTKNAVKAIKMAIQTKLNMSK